MNEKLEKLVDILITNLESGISWGKDNIPGLAEEMLRFDAYEANMYFWIFVSIPIIFLALTTISAILGVKIPKHKEPFSILSVICGIGLFFSVIIALIEAPEKYLKLKKIEKAPRIYLLEKLRSFK